MASTMARARCSLGRRQDDDEEREDLAGDAAVDVAGEGDEVQAGGVEDQLDAHQDGHRVAPRGTVSRPTTKSSAATARKWRRRAASLAPPPADLGRAMLLLPRRAMTIAPTRATSRINRGELEGEEVLLQERVDRARAVVGAAAATARETQGDLEGHRRRRRQQRRRSRRAPPAEPGWRWRC